VSRTPQTSEGAIRGGYDYDTWRLPVSMGLHVLERVEVEVKSFSLLMGHEKRKLPATISPQRSLF
jgi:hypothetical protein